MFIFTLNSCCEIHFTYFTILIWVLLGVPRKTSDRYASLGKTPHPGQVIYLSLSIWRSVTITFCYLFATRYPYLMLVFCHATMVLHPPLSGITILSKMFHPFDDHFSPSIYSSKHMPHVKHTITSEQHLYLYLSWICTITYCSRSIF